MSFIGNFLINSIIETKFTTVDTSGVAAGLSTSPILGIFKDNSTSSTIVGITTTIDFSSITGLNHVEIDLSQDGSFYSAGSDFQLVILAGTLTSSSSSLNGYVINEFSIENKPFSETELNQIADYILNRDMSTGTDSGSFTVRTPRQALRMLRNKWDITSGTLSVKKEDDSTESWSATIGSTTSANPIISVDPAGP